MILSYIQNDEQRKTKVDVIKFWMSSEGQRFGLKVEHEDGTVEEINQVKQCFLYDEKNPKNAIRFEKDKKARALTE